MSEHRVVYRDEGSYCGPISMLERLENGDLLVVFRHAPWEGVARRTHGHPATRTLLIRSTDGGRTWSDPISPDPDRGNGTCIAQVSGGMLILNNFRWTLVPANRRDALSGYNVIRESKALGMLMGLDGSFFTRSHDNGHTWEAVRPLNVPEYPDSTTAGRVIELGDGTLLMPMNGKHQNDADSFPWVACSTDRGETWHYRGTCGRPPGDFAFSENRILLLPDGRILSMVRTKEGNYWRAHSADGGATWSPMAETPITCRGSSPADLLLLADGRALCSYGRRRPEPKGVRACLSADGGETWDVANEIVLRDDAVGVDMGYPSTKQLADGSLLTVYYWHSDDEIRHLMATVWRLD